MPQSAKIESDQLVGQGRLVWRGEDRTEATLEGFFAWLGPGISPAS